MKLENMIGNLTDKMEYASSSLLIDNSTFVGFELEVERVGYAEIVDNLKNYLWDIKSDDSLRNGIELIFRKPLKGLNIIRAFENLQDVINNNHVENENWILSDRCSIHIHLDVRDMEVEDINNLIEVYMLFENILFDYVGYYRIKNNYCKPLLPSTFTDVLTDLRGEKEKSDYYIDHINEMCDKYSALNLRSMSSLGSLEFRHHPGTIDTSKMIEWINILLSLKKFINNNGTIDDLLSLSWDDSLRKVFGELSYKLIKANTPMHYFNCKQEVIAFKNNKELKENTENILKKNTKASINNSLIAKYKSKGNGGL